MNENKDSPELAGSSVSLPVPATVPISTNPGAKPVSVPRGLEVLLKKASVDPEFKELLLVSRAEASAFIGLKLEPNEILMLQAAPTDQLEAVIAQTQVPQEHRRAFLGRAAAAMLATLGVLSAKLACSQGTSPDRTFTNVLPPVSSTNLRTPLPFSPDQIEKHVKECIANRFHLEGKPISPTVELVKDLKASEIQLAGLKRQLEQDYDIKLAGQDFFKKVPTVGELIKAVQTAVKNRSAPPPEPATTLGIRPGATRGTRPD